MPNLNKVMLIGHLGGNPEVKTLPSGTEVATFGLATTTRYKSDATTHEKTEWHNIVCYGKLAELAKLYLSKGRPVFIDGQIQYRHWEDRDGNKKFRTEVVAQSMEFLGNKEGRGEAVGQAPAAVAQQPEDDLPF